MDTRGVFALVIAALVLLVLVRLGIMYFNYRTDKRRIEHYLRSKGATDVFILKVWFTHDRNTNTYEVIYKLQGEKRRTVCKIRSWLFSDADIYWKDPP